MQPRLQGAPSLKQKGPLKGVHGRKRNVNGAGDPKLEEENFLSAIDKFSKKREKISPGTEVGSRDFLSKYFLEFSIVLWNALLQIPPYLSWEIVK